MECELKGRSVVRASFTRLFNRMNEELKADPLDADVVNVTFQLLEKSAKDLAVRDRTIMDLMTAGDTTEETIVEDLEKADLYQGKFLRAQLTFKSLTSNCQNSRNNDSNDKKCKYKLPKIVWTQFSGKIIDWLSFWSQFKKVHEDKEIDKEDKFQYLIQATTPGSRARELVESYPPIGANYEKAVATLKSRFGREDVLVEVYVRELLKLVLGNALNPDNIKLSSLYDKLETYLRALETLGVTNDKCSSMLYPLVESSLHKEHLKAWQRSAYFSYGEDDDIERPLTGKVNSRLTQLMQFLRREVEGVERIDLAMEGFGLRVEEMTPSTSYLPKVKSVKNVATASSLISKVESGTKFSLGKARDNNCVFCNQDTHTSKECRIALRSSLAERREKLRKRGLCFRCLRVGCLSYRCKAQLTCKHCGKRHLELMCPISEENSLKENSVTRTMLTTKKDVSTTMNALAESGITNQVLLQTITVMLTGSKGMRAARAIIDTGSQYSYILDKVAFELGFDVVGKKLLQHVLFGGVKSGIQNHDCFKINVASVQNTNSIELVALSQTKICDYYPRILPQKCIEEVKALDIDLSNFLDQPGPIELLFGADIVGRLLTGRLYQLDSGLTAIETKLGWTVIGTVECENTGDKSTGHENLATTMLSSCLNDSAISNFWKLDVIGVEEPSAKMEQKDQMEATLRHFEATVSFNMEGRYEVKLPWVQDTSILPSNYAIACKRLQSATKKLISTGNYDRYDQVFKEWIEEELIEVVPETELHSSNVHYLPHRAIIKESSATTKVRPVFDASAKERDSPSLNSCLDKGPNMVELIPSELLRFRRHKFGISSDVRKAFQQISIFKKDRDYLRFLWWEDERTKIKHYRHRRVVFGITCSPFQLQAVIKHHLERCREGSVKGVRKDPQLEKTIDILLRCFYVDNCLTSLATKEEVEAFVRDANSLMQAGGFDLRCWEFSRNSEKFESETIEVISKVLGLSWNREEDSLGLNSALNCIEVGVVTKRALLSAVHRVFDPIGFTSPAVLTVKLMLKEVYEANIAWDVEVCAEVRRRYAQWTSELPYLHKVRIPRWLQIGSQNRSSLQIHTFVDASQNAYAAVVFLRCLKDDDTTRVTLIEAKSRLSPAKKMSIPRLELLAATIGARLTDAIRQELGYDIEVFYWTDSSTTLAWIQRSESWKIFVGNRVKEIRDLTDVQCWRHIPGDSNPADLPSRGCNPQKLAESKWWEGPSWLYKTPDKWPNSKVSFDEVAIHEEKKALVSASILATQQECQRKKWYCRYFSKYTQIVNLVSYILRFINNCRLQPADRTSGELTLKERVDAERCLLRCVQEEVYKGAELTKIKPLQPFVDSNRLIRVKTKLFEREDEMDFRCPYVLPGNHIVIKALIRDYHNRHCHAGTQILLNELRERFWIVRGRQSVRSVVSKCVVCRRYSSKALGCDAPPLPPDRVNDASPFQITGIDLAGPLYLKDNQKAWIVLFTCAVFRAVHLELVVTLSTNDFLQALRRFVARRGRPSVVYSDNGTNFVGAARAFRTLDWNRIQKYATEDQIQWKFNPPSACWWGGWWERLVGLVKQLLRRSLGKACLSYEEMVTILCDVEAVVNGRPLTYVAEDTQDLIPLTPSRFLHGNTSTGLPDCDAISAKSLNKRLKFLQKTREDLRARFRKEYLGQLVQKRCRRKEGFNQPTLRIGDVVLLEIENAKRMDWPLAKVEELITGRDGKVRLVRVKTNQNTMLRPTRRIYPLEVQEEAAVGLLRTAVTEV